MCVEECTVASLLSVCPFGRWHPCWNSYDAVERPLADEPTWKSQPGHHGHRRSQELQAGWQEEGDLQPRSCGGTLPADLGGFPCCWRIPVFDSRQLRPPTHGSSPPVVTWGSWRQSVKLWLKVKRITGTSMAWHTLSGALALLHGDMWRRGIALFPMVTRWVDIIKWGLDHWRHQCWCFILQGLWNAQYKVNNIIQHGQPVSLNHNHTHFLLVDDGMRGSYRGVAEFRARLERKLSSPANPTHGEGLLALFGLKVDFAQIEFHAAPIMLLSRTAPHIACWWRYYVIAPPMEASLSVNGSTCKISLRAIFPERYQRELLCGDQLFQLRIQYA